MTPEKANNLLAVQAFISDGYHRNDTEVQRVYRPEAVDQLVSTVELERIFSFKPGTVF